jgi:hypothetical protein
MRCSARQKVPRHLLPEPRNDRKVDVWALTYSSPNSPKVLFNSEPGKRRLEVGQPRVTSVDAEDPIPDIEGAVSAELLFAGLEATLGEDRPSARDKRSKGSECSAE